VKPIRNTQNTHQSQRNTKRTSTERDLIPNTALAAHSPQEEELEEDEEELEEKNNFCVRFA
jgi:hypothetical protein